jgi:hypothetical protein
MQPPIQVALVRGVAVLITPWRPAYFNSFARSKRYLSIARRMSSATGAPVLSDNAFSFLSWSSFKKRAARFMHTLYHSGIHMRIEGNFQWWVGFNLGGLMN